MKHLFALLKEVGKRLLYIFVKPNYDLSCCPDCDNFKRNIRKNCISENECCNAKIRYVDYQSKRYYLWLKDCENFKRKGRRTIK